MTEDDTALTARLMMLEEAVDMLARHTQFLGDFTDKQRLNRLGFGDKPAERSDGG